MVKQIDHPDVGPLTFHIEAVCSPHDAEQRLVVYTTEPDSATARALGFLASYAGPLGTDADASFPTAQETHR